MSKHTKGPWAIDTRLGHSIDMLDRYVITAPSVDRVAVVSRNGGADDAEANAQLIAAAPDLERVVERYVEMWTRFELRGGGHEPMVIEEHKSLLDDARAALARVKGATP